MTQAGPLADLVVADFSQLVQGPASTQVMGDLGAQVVKIEPPGGDWLRHFALGECFDDGQSVSFLAFNRNKRSIAIDLKTDEGLEVARAIVAKADILVENFRPGVMERLGLGYEAVSKDNPRLIYCAGSGYGRSGPSVDRPGQDLLAQAISGWAWLNGSASGPPEATAVGIADLTAAHHLVIGALAAVHSRETTGRGQRVDVSLLKSIMSLQGQELAVFLSGGPDPDLSRSDSGIPNPYSGAPYGIYATSDGWIAIAMTKVSDLARLAGIEDLMDIESNNVMQGRDQIRGRLAQAMIGKTTEDWMSIFTDEDVWAAEVQRYADVVSDPQVEAAGIIQSVGHPAGTRFRAVGPAIDLSETPTSIDRGVPALGQDTDQILRDVVGLEAGEIDTLRSGGAIS